MGTCKITPLRRRILLAIEQRGEMDLQEIGYEFNSRPRGRDFKHPAAATRFGGALTAPLRSAGYLELGETKVAYRRRLRVTDAGKAAAREEFPKGLPHDG